MGESYGASLHIKAFPVAGIIATRSRDGHPRYHLSHADPVEWALEHAEEFGALLGEMRQLGEAEHIDATRWEAGDGWDLDIYWCQLSYAIEALLPIRACLRECGLAYCANDDGVHEIPGGFVEWQPGGQTNAPAPTTR